MSSGFWMIILVHLLGCMSPGPDFIVVVKNTLNHDRTLALYTVLGVSLGILMHSTYCALGLGIVLLKWPPVFTVLKVLGAVYLFYMGLKIFLSKNIVSTQGTLCSTKRRSIKPWQAFRVGFFCNALNPKAVLFILGLFIMVTKWHSPWWSLFFVIEMTVVTGVWFSFIVYCFSHPKLKQSLLEVQGVISKLLALFLWAFALELLLGHT